MTRLRSIVRLIFIGFFGTTGAFMAAEYHYSYLPGQVYVAQVFPVTVLAQNAKITDEPRFKYRFPEQNHATPAPKGKIIITSPAAPHARTHLPIQPLPTKTHNNSDIFYTFYFQADGVGTFVVPPLTIRDANQTITLPSQSIPVTQLPAENNDTFCGLIATDCTLQTSQVSTFDDNNTLVSLTFQAHEGNPEAIRIPGASEQGIETITRKDALVVSEIYFVIPSTQTSITLSYYNPVQHRYIPFTIATDYHNKPVAAQVELNPKASPFDRLKKYGSIALALFFALMFLWRKDWLYLILLVIVSLLIYSVYKPRPMLCIQEGSSLYILPTHNSRSSMTITEKLHTRSLGEHEGYDKINYRNGIIGWIRHEDLCED